MNEEDSKKAIARANANWFKNKGKGHKQDLKHAWNNSRPYIGPKKANNGKDT